MAPPLASPSLNTLISLSADPDQHELLIQSLQGTTLVIPDLEAMLSHWPSAVSEHKDKVTAEVNERLEILFPNGNRLRKMKLADAALLGSSVWPYANYENLCVVTHWLTWLLAWDDELDTPAYSNLFNDYEGASAYRAETITYIQASLQKEDQAQEVSNDYIITDIKRVCDAVRQQCSPETTQSVCAELTSFVQACQIEHEHQIANYFPSYTEYMERRNGTVSVRVGLALLELASGIALPQHIMADPLVSQLWDATTIIVAVMNDVLSFKKEFAQDQLDSVLPILCLEHGSMERAMEVVRQLLEESVKDMDRAAEQLLEKYGETPALRKDLEMFIDTFKYACTGNLSWSLVSGRYKIGQTSTKGGLCVVLE